MISSPPIAPPQVTICIPVYNGAAFVAQALNSVARQSHRNVHALISDDASTDGSAELCRGIAQEHGFELIVQPQRRGWIENCNFLLARARGDFVCIVPHDDVLDERYVEVLVAHLSATPACVQAFCDVRNFGSNHGVSTQESICGTPFERLYRLLNTHFDGTAFRGLVRREALDRAGGLPHTALDGFAADINWLARLAREGEIHRVPQPLYFKRFHPLSASHQWSGRIDDTKITAWTDHCADLLDVALGLELSEAERWLMIHAALRRLIMANEEWRPYPVIRHLPNARKVAMADALLQRLVPPRQAGEMPAEQRRRHAALVVEALATEHTAATIRALEAPGRPPASAGSVPYVGAEFAATPRTLANLLRFLRKRPLRLG